MHCLISYFAVFHASKSPLKERVNMLGYFLCSHYNSNNADHLIKELVHYADVLCVE